MTQEAIALRTTGGAYPGLEVVQDVNKALDTIATDFAGPSDPAALAGPYMTWADTGNMLLKRRNAANSAWVTLGPLLDFYFARSNILGTVSQTSGVPTGAIIERGSNSNGEYIKFADGTLVCFVAYLPGSQSVTSPYGSIFTTGIKSWTFPASFLAGTFPAVSGGLRSSGGGIASLAWSATDAAGVSYYITNPSSYTGTIGASLTAIGRWF